MIVISRNKMVALTAFGLHPPCLSYQGLVNVLIEHHPNIGNIISNRYLKVMFKIPKKGHLPTPGKCHVNGHLPQGGEGIAERLAGLYPHDAPNKVHWVKRGLGRCGSPPSLISELL